MRWKDIDRSKGLLYVRRTYTEGRLKDYGKTDPSPRAVPLRKIVLDALDAHPRRSASDLIFPAARGGFINLRNWRDREWKPTFVATGIEKRVIYDCRHSYAVWCIQANINLFALARRMGTSLAMIDRTYGHLMADAAEYETGLLDTLRRCFSG